MKFLTLALALAGAANAHTMLSKIYINGESQGEATCVRTPMDGNTATSPVAGLTSEAMACGKSSVFLSPPSVHPTRHPETLR